eukprot:6857431-Pyramimonas_sp.AAC.1
MEIWPSGHAVYCRTKHAPWHAHAHAKIMDVLRPEFAVSRLRAEDPVNHGRPHGCCNVRSIHVSSQTTAATCP